MQALRSLATTRRSLPSLFLRRLSSIPTAAATAADDLQNEVLVEGKAAARAAVLNRPEALNAINTNMTRRLKKLYESWEDNSDIGFVMLKGSGRAFCAGGDIVSLYRSINEGKLEDAKEFFRTIYSFIYILGTYLKPHVAIMNGIVMGGGAGVSIPGTFRVATDKTYPTFFQFCLSTIKQNWAAKSDYPVIVGLGGVSSGTNHYASIIDCGISTTIRKEEEPNLKKTIFKYWIFATPETHIGFHPDAGASFYLSHLTGHVGEYLGLTGERLNGVDMLALGLATHYSMSDKLDWVDERLANLVTDDPSVIESSLAQYGDIVFPDKNSVAHRLKVIDDCFGCETVEEIIDALEMEAGKSNEEWCISALKKLKEACPLSLKVSLRSIREGRFQPLEQCLIREYRMTVHGISKQISNDYCEGVRARLVEKDMAPKWDPPTLQHVSDDMVEAYFAPLDEFDSELVLPIESREAFF